MTRTSHKIYIYTLTAITVVVFLWLAIYGADYYSLALEQRHSHIKYDILKPTGLIGHGIGIVGSSFLIIGVFGYMARKRFRRFSRIGQLKYWLEFHIFLCTLGPILVLYHTTFKFGGIVSISFWSMIAVVISGVIGRFIYLQIPHTIQGRELSLGDLTSMEEELYSELKSLHNIDYETISDLNRELDVKSPNRGENFIIRIVKRFRFEQKLMKRIRNELKSKKLSGKDYRKVIRLFKSKIKLNRRISWLSSMQNFLRYWHVAHLPFALIMLVIMLIHVAVALVFGYNWIF
jgi:hypothetical protein